MADNGNLTIAQQLAGLQIGVPKNITAQHMRDIVLSIDNKINTVVKLGSVTADNDAAVEFADGIDDTFKFYIIRFWCIPAADNAVLWFRVSTDGGSTFAAGASDYQWANGFAGSSAGAQTDTADSEIQLTGNQGTGSEAGEGCAGEVTIFDPSDTTLEKHIISHLSNHANNGTTWNRNGQGLYQFTTAVNGFQFLFSSGDIESGEFVLYGVK